jgi:hypothetical protein
MYPLVDEAVMYQDAHCLLGRDNATKGESTLSVYNY